LKRCTFSESALTKPIWWVQCPLRIPITDALL
jgi:hypothetical protein